jgi:glycolate oxidase FAD binding subunit
MLCRHPYRSGGRFVPLANVQLDATVALTPHQPASANEIGDLVRQTSAAGQAVYPAGGQTQWDLGLSPAKSGILLDLRRLDNVIEYPARDMTITVEAGMTIAKLQGILAGENQRLPIDVPYPDRATVGGILATNVSGPRRYGFGTLRDYVIGITVVNDQGQPAKAGGRVVKNVAGYDMCKLYVGSLGTLGVISQVTFKLRPKPAEQALFAFVCPREEIAAALTQMHATRTRPVCIELLNPAAAIAAGECFKESWPPEWTIVVGFEDNAVALKWQVGQLVSDIGSGFTVSGLLGSCADPLWNELVEFAGVTDAALSFKAGVPPSKVAAFCVEVDRMLDQVRLKAHAGNGIVVGHCVGEDVAARLPRVRELAVAAGGHLIVTQCPAAWKTVDFVWGPPRPGFEMMRAIKDKLDPGHVFNAGRFVV